MRIRLRALRRVGKSADILAANPLAWGYLYQGSPRLLALIGSQPFLRGHTAPLVAYVINQGVAEIFLWYYEGELLAIISPTTGISMSISNGLRRGEGPRHTYR